MERCDRPDTEEIGDADIGKHDDTTAACTLNGSAGDDHGEVNGQRANQTADEEKEVGDKNDALATPDITDLAP